MVQSGTEWYRVVQSGTEWYRVVQSGTEWCRVVQSGTEWYRVVQSGAEVVLSRAGPDQELEVLYRCVKGALEGP